MLWCGLVWRGTVWYGRAWLGGGKLVEVSEIIALAVTLILAVLSVFFGREYKIAREGFSKLRHKTGQIHGIISAIEVALEDHKVTKEEAEDIINKIHKLVEKEE